MHRSISKSFLQQTHGATSLPMPGATRTSPRLRTMLVTAVGAFVIAAGGMAQAQAPSGSDPATQKKPAKEGSQSGKEPSAKAGEKSQPAPAGDAATQTQKKPAKPGAQSGATPK